MRFAPTYIFKLVLSLLIWDFQHTFLTLGTEHLKHGTRCLWIVWQRPDSRWHTIGPTNLVRIGFDNILVSGFMSNSILQNWLLKWGFFPFILYKLVLSLLDVESLISMTWCLPILRRIVPLIYIFEAWQAPFRLKCV